MADKHKFAEAYVELKVKQDQIVKGMADADKRVKKTANDIESRFKKIKFDPHQVTKGFDGINLSAKELKQRLVDLDAKMLRLAKTTGLSVNALSRVGGGKTREKFQAIQSEITSTKNKLNQFNTTTRKVSTTSQKAANGLRMMAIRMAAFFVVLGSARAAFSFTRAAKNAARDALETKTKFLQVFSSIRDEAEITARSLARSFGIANTTARELIGNTGDLLVGFGFTEKKSLLLANRMVKLAGDLASFKNIVGGTPKALNLMISAMSGITQASKSLGVVISQRDKGFIKLVKTMQNTQGLTFQQARALAVLDEFFKQSKKAVGDYQRTKDNLANTERRLNEEFLQLKVTIGQKLTPAFLGATRAALSLLRSLTESDMDKAIRKLSELGVKAEDLKIILNTSINRERFKTLEEEKLNLKAQVGYAKQLAHINKLFTKPIKLFLSGGFKKQKKQVDDLRESIIKLTKERIKKGGELIPFGEEDRLTFLYNVLKDIIKAKEKINTLNKEFKPSERDQFNALIRKGLRGGFKNANKEITKTKKTVGEIETDISNLTKAQKKTVFQSKEWWSLEKKILALEKSITAEKKKQVKLLDDSLDKIDKSSGEKATGTVITPTNAIPTLASLDIAFDPSKRPAAINKTKDAIDELNNSLFSTQNLADMVRGGFEEVGSSLSSAMGNAIKIFGQANSVLQQFIQGLIQAIAKALIFKAITSALGFIGLSEGGSVQVGGGIKAATGLKEFKVPPGYPNDSFPVMVESGERVTVTPANQVVNNNFNDNNIVNSIKALNANLIKMGNRPVQLVLQSADPYASVKQTNNIMERLLSSNVKSQL